MACASCRLSSLDRFDGRALRGVCVGAVTTMGHNDKGEMMKCTKMSDIIVVAHVDRKSVPYRHCHVTLRTRRDCDAAHDAIDGMPERAAIAALVKAHGIGQRPPLENPYLYYGTTCCHAVMIAWQSDDDDMTGKRFTAWYGPSMDSIREEDWDHAAGMLPFVREHALHGPQAFVEAAMAAGAHYAIYLDGTHLFVPSDWTDDHVNPLSLDEQLARAEAAEREAETVAV